MSEKVKVNERELLHFKLCARDRSLLGCFPLGVSFRFVSPSPLAGTVKGSLDLSTGMQPTCVC